MTPEARHTASASSRAEPVARPARRHVVSGALVAGLVALGLLFVFSDLRELWRTASTLEPWLLLPPFLLGLLSYALMALSYQGIARAAGAPLPYWDMLKITFVGNTVNYLVTTGGLSGLAVRIYFFMRRAVPSGTAVIIALVQMIITNSVLLLFLVGGFAYLLTAHDLHGLTLVTLGLLLGVFFLAAGAVVALLVNREFRRRTLFLLAEGTHRFMHRFAPRHKPGRVHVWRFQRNLNRGIDFLLARKRNMIGPTLWIVIDWVVTLLILRTAFATVHFPIPMSFVVVGFAVGVALSMVSFIPGGIGVMEGSMAAIFVSLDVPFETAVVAVLIFRIAYYVVPLVISAFFFRGMLFQGTHLPPDVLEQDPPVA